MKTALYIWNITSPEKRKEMLTDAAAAAIADHPEFAARGRRTIQPAELVLPGWDRTTEFLELDRERPADDLKTVVYFSVLYILARTR